MSSDLYNDPVKEMDLLPLFYQKKTQIWIEGKLIWLYLSFWNYYQVFLSPAEAQRVSLGFLFEEWEQMFIRKHRTSHMPTYMTTVTHILTMKVQEAYGFHSQRDSFWFRGSVSPSAVQLRPSYRTSLGLQFFIGIMGIIIRLNTYICCEDFMKQYP